MFFRIRFPLCFHQCSAPSPCRRLEGLRVCWRDPVTMLPSECQVGVISARNMRIENYINEQYIIARINRYNEPRQFAYRTQKLLKLVWNVLDLTMIVSLHFRAAVQHVNPLTSTLIKPLSNTSHIAVLLLH